MTKENNIEKAYDFGASEFNCKMKKLYNGRSDAFESFYKFVKENGLTHKYQVWLP